MSGAVGGGGGGPVHGIALPAEVKEERLAATKPLVRPWP